MQEKFNSTNRRSVLKTSAATIIGLSGLSAVGSAVDSESSIFNDVESVDGWDKTQTYYLNEEWSCDDGLQDFSYQSGPSPTSE